MSLSKLTRRATLGAAFSAVMMLAGVNAASAADVVEYKPGVVQSALKQGKTVFIDYTTHWCTTCASQKRTINALRDANTAYNEMVFVRVDWDIYSGDEISTKYKIPRRSTLLVLNGDQELGRIVAGTSKSKIKALMDKGLSAAKNS